MKIATLASIGLGLVVGATAARAQAPAPKADGELKTTEQKIAYTLGINIGRGLKQSGIDSDPTLISQGIRDALADKPALTDAQMAEVMQIFKTQLMAKAQDGLARQQGAGGAGGQAADAEKNLKAGQAFLAENRTKPGVVVLPSGVQYKVLTEGPAGGKSPTVTDEVVAHYRGTLIDGTEFDSSYKRGKPTPFPVNRVIKGWTEILQKMKVGDKYQVFIPSEMAYGEAQRGALIAPNSTLIFDIELLEVK